MRTDPTREVICSYCGSHQFDGCWNDNSCKRKEIPKEKVNLNQQAIDREESINGPIGEENEK